MTLQQILGYVIVIGLIGGGALYFTGYLDSEGFNEAKLQADLKVNPYDKADTFFTAQQFSEAMNQYQTALREDPKNSHAVRAQYRIARCQDELGQDAEAKAAYKQFIDEHPTHEDVAKARRYLATLGG